VNHIKNGTVFRREYTPLFMLFPVFGGLIVVFGGIYGMSDGFTTWRLPVWEMDFFPGLLITVFLLVWFGIGGGVIWSSLRCLHTVHITADEIMIRLGPLVLHKMPLSEVRSVVRIKEPAATYGESPLLIGWDKWRASQRPASPRLVLLSIPAEELLEQAAGSDTQGEVPLGLRTDAYESGKRIKKHVEKTPKLRRFWIGHTSRAEEALREYLSTAVFIL